jgi:hypothetical protein
VYLGGSRQAETARLATAGRELLQLQRALQALSASGRAGRSFHRMGRAFPATYVPLPAEALDPHWVPPAIRTALLDPALAVVAGFARFSYGRGDDNLHALMPDARGLWVRLLTRTGVQDLTATNMAVPFFDDPEELIAFGFATQQLVQEMKEHPFLTPVALLRYEPHLAAQLMRLKPAEFASELAAHQRAASMLAGVAPSAVPVPSFAEAQFWSGAPLYIRGTDGRSYAFKYTFRPDPAASQHVLPSDDLFGELDRHPRVRYELCTQLYIDDENTPIEGAAAWNVPECKVGDVYIETAQPAIDAHVDPQGSNPGNHMDGLSPAGLNRLRVDLYAADVRGRGGCPFAHDSLYGRAQ